MVNSFDYSTLETDRKQKVPLYATARIADYWILDVNQRQVYVFREPGLEDYNLEFILQEDATLSLILFSEIEVQISQSFHKFYKLNLYLSPIFSKCLDETAFIFKLVNCTIAFTKSCCSGCKFSFSRACLILLPARRL